MVKGETVVVCSGLGGSDDGVPGLGLRWGKDGGCGDFLRWWLTRTRTTRFLVWAANGGSRWR